MHVQDKILYVVIVVTVCAEIIQDVSPKSIQNTDIAYRKFKHSTFAIGRYASISRTILASKADSSDWYIAFCFVYHPEMITAT